MIDRSLQGFSPWRAGAFSRFVALALIAAPMLASGGDGTAHGAAKETAVSNLMTQDLAGIEGKEAVMLTVAYGPGGSSLPHRHDANVFVYVLEGSVVMQVEGKPRVTLHAGETFYEGPQDVHAVSANASQSKPAKLLVFVVKDKGAPLTRAVTR